MSDLYEICTQTSFADIDDDYRAFVDKFKPKRTTDDCFTPPAVFEAVADWASKEYGFAKESIVRPFFPNGDYERHPYRKGDVVVDNPPFSIISRIARFYNSHGIPYFLFAPHLTMFSIRDSSYIVTNVDVIYDNGANVSTSFATNMDEWKIRSAPDLRKLIKDAQKKDAPQPPKYVYPNCIITVSKIAKLSRNGVDFRVPKEACTRVSKIEANPKGIYGGGYMLSEEFTEKFEDADAMADAAAIENKGEKRPTIAFELSEAEKAMQKMLG